VKERESKMAKPRNFREAMDSFETAVRDHAWKGAKHPGERDGIEMRYQEAKDNLAEYFTEATERAFRRGAEDTRSRDYNSRHGHDMGQ
jgi:hypothetical protein